MNEGMYEVGTSAVTYSSRYLNLKTESDSFHETILGVSILLKFRCSASL